MQIAIGLCRPKLGIDAAPLFDERGNAVQEALYTWYALRHTYASIQIDLGILPKQLQKRMGHASLQVTLDIYGHLWKDCERDSQDMAAMDQWFKNLPRGEV
jgi:integrase